jgi:hypothetical protein
MKLHGLLSQKSRITTQCLQDPRESPHLVERGIRPLVLQLHDMASIQCIASCHGHGWWRGLKREPYLYFHAEPEIAEWISAIVEALPLSRQWKIDGIMHPERGLCFSLEPLEQSPFFAGPSADWKDLEILANVLPDHVCFPQQEQSTYRDKKEAAQKLVPALIERVGVFALWASVSSANRTAQRFPTFLTRFQRHDCSSDM